MKDSLVRVLRWSEKYTKTDMVYLVKNSGWVFLGQMATSASAFVVMVALANMVDKAEYGEYRFVISMILILSIATLPGMNTSLVQATAQGKTGQLVATTKTRMKYGILGSVASLLIAGYYFINNNTSLAISFAIVAMFLPFYNTFFGYYFYLQGKQLFNQSAIVQGLSRVLFLIGMLTTAYLAPTAPYLIAMYMAVTLVMQYVGYRWTISHHPEDQSQKSETHETTSYGVYLSMWASPNLIAAQASVVLIWFFIGDIEAAIYAVALTIPMEFNRLGSILNQVAMPKMSKGATDIHALFRKIIKLEIIFLFIWIGYTVTASHIFNFFFPEYPEAVIYSIVLMLMIFLVPRMILHALINAKKMRKTIQKVSIITPVFHIILAASLIPLYGLWGAIFATLLSWLIECILLLVLVKNNLGPNRLE